MSGSWDVDYSAVETPGREILVDEEEKLYLHLVGRKWIDSLDDGGDENANTLFPKTFS